LRPDEPTTSGSMLVFPSKSSPLLLPVARKVRAGSRAAIANPSATRALRVRPLELPRGEASDVHMELVQSGVVPVAGELDLELQLGLGHGLATHGAERADARPAPCPIWRPGGELPGAYRIAGLFSEAWFVGQGRSRRATGRSHAPRCRAGRNAPDARGRDARCVNQEARWKAPLAYHRQLPSGTPSSRRRLRHAREGATFSQRVASAPPEPRACVGP
jgi:hypothetical protein